MNTDQFKAVYNESRNGTDAFHFNPLYRRFLYSDGVRELAETGCYWLLDILGTELPGVFRRHPGERLLIVKVRVADNAAIITGSFTDDTEEYRREVDYTDLPEGEWALFVSDDGDGKLRCILPTEY